MTTWGSQRWLLSCGECTQRRRALPWRGRPRNAACWNTVYICGRKPRRLRAQALAQSFIHLLNSFISAKAHTAILRSSSKTFLSDFNHCGLQPPLVRLPGACTPQKVLKHVATCVHTYRPQCTPTFRSPTATMLIEDGRRIHSLSPKSRRFLETGRLLKVTELKRKRIQSVSLEGHPQGDIKREY